MVPGFDIVQKQMELSTWPAKDSLAVTRQDCKLENYLIVAFHPKEISMENKWKSSRAFLYFSFILLNFNDTAKMNIRQRFGL